MVDQFSIKRRSTSPTVSVNVDRILSNQIFLDIYPNINVKHLIKKGSDHSPLEVQCSQNLGVIHKPFKFLNFWVKHEDFMKIVKEHWVTDVEGNPFQILHYKLKKLKGVLSFD